ncbi:NUDIX hydrolase, partial [Candidatus Kaiserbacteria bacterium]|nr:NUDIX hydrolase [Candidatus Kaiserbacteria bacterium]
PCSPAIFDAWCGAFITNPLELAVLRRGSSGVEIFLIHREDKFFKGWHMPGTVILPGNKVAEAFERLVKKEVGTPTTKAEFIMWKEFMKGDRDDLAENPRGQELSLLFAVFVDGNVPHGTFFPLDAIPDTTLGHHKQMIGDVQDWLAKRTG